MIYYFKRQKALIKAAAIMIMIFLLMTTCVFAASAPGFVQIFSSHNYDLSGPRGIAVDSTGNIYVADTYHNRIQKINADGTLEAMKNGSVFSGPTGIAADSEGNIYVAYPGANCIQKLKNDGTLQATWGGNGQFNIPDRIAVDSGGNIYVADADNNRIQKLNKDGQWEATWGSYGSGYKQFNLPRGIAVDSEGNIYVADTNNNRIQKIKTDGTWKSFNIGIIPFNHPGGVAVDSTGNIYVEDTGNNCIQKLNKDGQWEATWGSYGSGDGQFNFLGGIAVDSEGNIYVSDILNNCIQRMDVRPVILKTAPLTDEKNAAVNQNVIITFNENIFSSDKIDMISFKDGETAVNFTCEISGKTLTLKPAENLGYNHTYTVTIPKEAIKDSAGYSLKNDYSFSFKTGVNPAPLKIISITPDDNADKVDIHTLINLLFSEKIQQKDMNLITLKKGALPIDYDYNITTDGLLTIDPKEDLSYSSLYHITVGAGAVQDMGHNPLKDAYVFSFKTGPLPDASAPYVISTIPTNHETKVLADQAIKVTFSENIQQKDISLLTLKQGELVIDYNCNITTGGILTLQPKTALNYGTTYTVTLPGGTMQDDAYNASEPFAFSFITLNNNAGLSNMLLSQGTLSPSFAPDITSYEASVGYNTLSITVTPVLQGSNGMVKINGIEVVKDTPSGLIPLKVGSNVIPVLVTAEDGLTTKEYTLIVKRTGQNNQNSGSQGSSGNAVSAQPKTLKERLDGYTTAQKESIKVQFVLALPYTTLNQNDSVFKTLQSVRLLADHFTVAELQQIAQDQALLEELGISVSSLTKEVKFTEVQNASFTDLTTNHWAYNTIRQAAALGLAAGMPDGRFAPGSSLQAADTFTFLDRALLPNGLTQTKLPRSTVEKYISNKDHWAFFSMASTASRLNESTLKAISELGDKPLSRELLAQVLYEITDGKLKPVRDDAAFADIEDSPYKEAISYCIRTGLLSGIDSTHMEPKKALTRAELMTVLIRLNERLK